MCCRVGTTDVTKAYCLCSLQLWPKWHLGQLQPELGWPRNTVPKCRDQRFEAVLDRELWAPAGTLGPSLKTLLLQRLLMAMAALKLSDLPVGRFSIVLMNSL